MNTTTLEERLRLLNPPIVLGKDVPLTTLDRKSYRGKGRPRKVDYKETVKILNRDGTVSFQAINQQKEG